MYKLVILVFLNIYFILHVLRTWIQVIVSIRKCVDWYFLAQCIWLTLNVVFYKARAPRINKCMISQISSFKSQNTNTMAQNNTWLNLI